MSVWHIKKDLKSLFSCGNDYFQPINGLRSISCLMIITVHLISLLTSLIPPYPHPDWLNYIKSFSFSLTSLLTLSLETFFVISGFLLTNKFVHQWDRMKTKNEFFQQYPVYILRRACRYWPGILLVSLIMFLLGDSNGNYTSMWLFFQNYVDMHNWSVGMGPMWSVSLDMQMHILLPLLLYFMYSYRKSISVFYLLYALVVLSVVYSLVVFNPRTMDIMAVVSRYNTMAILMPERIAHWIHWKYNVTLPLVILNPNPMKIFMERLYLPLLSRYSSFIIGSILALKLINVKCISLHTIDTMKKFIYFVLVWCYMLVLVIPPPSSNAEQSSVNDMILTIFISCMRPLFATCQAFLLFTAICPISHPYHSSVMKSVLSCRIWSPIAKLSYLVYVLHFPIAFQLIMSAKLCNINRYSIDYSVLLHLSVVFVSCLLIACVWHVLIEKPFQRWIHRILPCQLHNE